MLMLSKDAEYSLGNWMCDISTGTSIKHLYWPESSNSGDLHTNRLTKRVAAVVKLSPHALSHRFNHKNLIKHMLEYGLE